MHKTPEEAAKAVMTGDLGPLQLTFSEFRYRMTTEYPQEPLSDQFLFDLYHDLNDKPEDTPTFAKLKALFGEDKVFTIPIDETTTKPEDLFGPIDMPEEPEVDEWPVDVLAAIEALDGKVDKMQALQERIYRMELAKQAKNRKNRRDKAIAKVRNKFRRRHR